MKRELTLADFTLHTAFVFCYQRIALTDQQMQQAQDILPYIAAQDTMNATIPFRADATTVRTVRTVSTVNTVSTVSTESTVSPVCPVSIVVQ